ncbi:MAG: hypothetical protein HZA66_11115 [Rhodopseudomonas palustris]|uniref:Uncharacterized protein n=1 Tax=Rhodopseudomonas palustris TaxID=1076 RepID=A0A933W103_RHOPL|nr:hypothetical protein [Rhodopseudomonas palustris]
MKDWYAVCAIGVVIIVGSAAGLGGTVAFLLAFGITWYLLTASEIGFAKARDILGIKLLPPIWQRSNWLWLDVMLDDGDKLLRAATIALGVVGIALMFRPDFIYGAAALIAAFYVSEILRGMTGPLSRAVRIPDAGARSVDVAPRAIAAASPLAIAPPALALPIASDPEPTLDSPISMVLSPIVAPPIVAAPARRVIVGQPRELRKPAVTKQRPIGRPAAKRSNGAKRPLRDKSKRPERTQPPLPSRKPDYPIALRPRKPQRRPPLLRRRTMRKAATQIGRGAPKRAAVARH